MDFRDLLKSGKVIVWDGAMGTNLVRLCVGSFVRSLKCNEELNLIHPDIIRKIHEEFLAAGAEVIETNTFGANRITLADHGLADKVHKINLAAVKIAKNAVTNEQTNQPACRQARQTNERFISGSIGPTSKLPTLGHISFDEMVDVYKEQAAALIEGGVDILQIETCQDILQAKAAVVGCREASLQVLKSASPQVNSDVKTCGPADLRTLPIIVTITIEKTGTTLLGTEIGAALSALLPYGIDAFGLNCGAGPKEMEENIRYLVKNSPLPVIVMPNAGLPEIRDGKSHYNLSPEEFGKWMKYFTGELGVQIVGGCCGTTPEHIRALVRSCVSSFVKKIKPSSQISSLYSPVNIDQEPKPLIVGERMNINGSKKFKESILKDDFDSAALMAKEQARDGAHALDLSIAYAGRDEVEDINKIASRLAKTSPLPLMIDSTSPEVIDAALSHFGGRSIINSINLEDGGMKAKKVCQIAKRHGAALIALTIDEEGMALTADKKIAIAKRLIDFCRDQKIWSRDGALFIDPLTFTLADPKAAEFGSGHETLKALKQLKRLKTSKSSRPFEVRTILGISNISFGLKPVARKVLNSVFLYEAVRAGLDAAIVHAGQILPLHKIDPKGLKLAKALIYNKGKNALTKFIEHFEDKTSDETKRPKKDKLKPSEQLKFSIINGEKSDLGGTIEMLLKENKPQDVINKILLPAMQEVGDLFGAGKLALPFVLQSAETMRESVDILAPHLEAGKSAKRGKIVIATVRGDVHDIGKNLVDIILSNNGFEVINLGVKQSIDTIINVAQEKQANAIGLSGLLVQSCFIMKEDLLELAHRGIELPVICGGAALTRKFVENDLQKVYNGRVFYAKDAFEGLKIMQELK